MPLDPQCQELIDIVAAAGGPPFDAGDYAAIRAEYTKSTAVYKHPTPHLARVENLSFEGPASSVGVRYYEPDAGARQGRGGLVYFHGGGWVVGDLDTHDHVCRYLAGNSGAPVFSIDYRLAPEHPFPAGLDDCIAAIEWVRNNAHDYDIDPACIAVGGDSAGANLAAAAVIQLRDTDAASVAFQLLIYPAVDLTADTDSLRDFSDGYLLSRSALENFTDLYLPDASMRSDPLVSPSLRADLSRLPRTFIQTAEFDPLRDEARLFAEKLMAAGTPVEYKCYPGMVHGFIRMGAKVDLAFGALDDACGMLREVFS